MNQERWDEVKRVLGSALELEDGQRAKFLAKSCANDTALRREVESLLSRSTQKWEEVAEEVRSSRVSADSPAGQRIGAYVVLKELGRGGMGAVYLARRGDEEFQKEVAIKLLKRGTDTEEVLRRFKAERDILARLEHPNIARLLDGGTTEGGLPYFIMEYVKGVPLNEFCVEKRLGIEEKLRLFLKICAAVRFAHQNLVVHRDLKPANILVAEDGEPKLLDFGIAKLLAPGEHIVDLTVLDQQRLTPAYASPEQVLGEPITTVSDVYSLGTLLYEILSGKPAHVFSTAHPAATELRRAVIEQEPARPSAVAVEAWLARRLRGDLDNIVLKALRKEPDRRYGGVGDFSEDIRRYLDDRPVQARPDTLFYRSTKLFKRNRIAVIAAAVVAGTLILGTVITTREAQEARRARAKAEGRFNDLRKIANSFMLELNSAIKDLPGSLRARQMLTSRALEYLDNLAREAGDDLSLKKELATSYEKFGLVTFDVEQALATHRKAAKLSEQLVQASPMELLYRSRLAQTYANLSDVLKIAGNSTESINYARKSVDHAQAVADKSDAAMAKFELAGCYGSLDASLGDAGFFHQAVEAARAKVRILERLGAGTTPDRDRTQELAEAYGDLSDDLEEIGDDQAARSFGNKAEALTNEILQRDPASARNQRDMWAAELRKAGELSAIGRVEEAEEFFGRALKLISQLSAADPSDRGHRYWTAATGLALGEFYLRHERPKEALQSLTRALDLDERLSAEDPSRIEAQRDLVRVYGAIGQAHEREGRKSKALELFLRAESLGRMLATKDSNNLRVKAYLAEVEALLGDFYSPSPSSANAPSRRYYLQSVELWQAIKNRGGLRVEDGARFNRVEAVLGQTSEP